MDRILSLWHHFPLRYLMSRSQSRREQPVSALGISSRFLQPHMLILLSMISVQLGAALAKGLFPEIGSSGTVLLRLVFAAIVLLLLWRPRIRDYTRREYALILTFGIVIAGMNAFFYASIARLPLGIAVTLEFLGPLAVALISSRRLLDLFWAICAGVGVILLTPIQGASFDLLGVVLALLAATCWGIYILLGGRVGQTFHGGTGLALGMSIGAIAIAPFGLSGMSAVWHNPAFLLPGFGVAILSSVIPFSLELEALRRLPPRVFGILMSMEPVVAATIGLLVLHETVGLRALIAMAFIVIASGGVSFSNTRNH